MITNPTKSKIAEEMIQVTICLTSIKQSLNSVFPSGFFFGGGGGDYKTKVKRDVLSHKSKRLTSLI